MSDILSEEFKRLIAGRAETLTERVENPAAFEHAIRDRSEAAEAFEEWEDVFPETAVADRRLAKDDLKREDIRRAATVDKLADDVPFPEWIHSLEALLSHVLTANPDTYRRDFDGGDPSKPQPDDHHAFPELVDAIAEYARTQLPDTPVEDVLSERAIDAMVSWFKGQVSGQFVRILFVEFKTFVAVKDEDRAHADPDEFDELPTEYYDEFIEYLFSGGITELCQEYPVFARLIVKQIRLWTEHVCEFSRRLQADREALARRFEPAGELGSLRDLEPLADDTHGGGRAVMRVTFESGTSIVYKPRTVEAGETFYSLVDRLNAHLSVPDFRTPTFLDREDYGWMEWVGYEECADTGAVERYYERAGALVCLTYLLNFTDCQYENLIISGEQPILIDAETVCAPYFNTERCLEPSGSTVLMANSVLLSHLLPTGTTTDGQLDGLGEVTPGFGVSGDVRELPDLTNSTITAVNTDVMTIEEVPVELDVRQNVPSVEEELHPPDEYLTEIIDGFRTAYETILELRDQGTLSEIGFPDAFESVENRAVYRPTVKYASCIDSLSARACLHDGVRFETEIERLTLPYVDGRVTGDGVWPFYEMERRKLTDLEPPRFTSRTDETAIRLNGSDIGVDADKSGLQVCHDRIESADREEMHRQIEFIRGAFEAPPNPTASETKDAPLTPQPISDDRLREEAGRLFESVREASIQVDSGQHHWGSIAPRNESMRLALKPGDHSLYTGRTGIALLGAALYRLTGEERYRSFTRDTLRATRRIVRGEQLSSVLHVHGGCDGIGAVAYALGVAGELLDDEAMLEEATSVAEFVTTESLERDEAYDVNNGAAGTILGLLAVHDRCESDAIVSAAADCGDHLLSNRVTTDDGLRVWETLDDAPPLTGFAHGACGIAYALFRLADVTGESKYRDAGAEALEFESRKYSERAQNWPDERPWIQHPFQDRWCYGRSGAGLARLGIREYDASDRVTRGIDRALSGMTLDGGEESDHLCCGETGRAEFLLTAETRRGDRIGDARELLGGIVDRRDRIGTYLTLDETDRITNPTFFHGVSGIAYTMLRAVEPETIPNVLLWE